MTAARNLEPVRDRQYVAEMRALIDAETASGDYSSPLVAEHIVNKLRVTDPALLQGWLDAQAVQFVRHMINLRDCSARTHARTAAAGKLNGRGWGKTNKGLLSYISEHAFVVEERLHLGVTEPSGINQRFVHTFRGSGIQYEEYVEDAKISFTVIADHDFTEKEWATIWLTGENQGLGASRSQGYGRYQVTRWEKA
jgi:hypothetical protein